MRHRHQDGCDRLRRGVDRGDRRFRRASFARRAALLDQRRRRAPRYGLAATGAGGAIDRGERPMTAPLRDITPAERAGMTSFNEASARTRLELLLDAGSFVEFIGPEQREVSPHLRIFDLPEQFDDGIVVGRGRLNGSAVFVAAQEGRFLGGAFGEVHGAKLVGLLRAARDNARKGRPSTMLLLLDTGGVRLQEANAGEVAIAETMRAIIEASIAGVAVIALIGGRAGAFGGGGLITSCCSCIVVSEHARIGVSGPEVIETNKGVEEFDSKDRALVWRVCGGRTRALMGG